ncbi:RagB/SusD family nutrient uptake outer membrane protein [Dysgonomonas massiliensis]|uniref:RagB/SusD family nutrient uptake outer membrane protein n=1 Tax=Dysgonomonas massiliensis TaxID=2040292 RepID=UPI000C783FC9|nr:RagB/SusD family nutrient uptake outer membrane protein [Dysgonomonas massiliensis]
MKKYIYILLVCLGINFTSCETDVVNPNTGLTENFWTNEQNAKYGLNAAYNYFYKPETFSRWIWFRLDLTSDEGFSASPWAELKEWTQFNYNNYNFYEGNNGTIGAFYRAIFRANQVLHHVPNIEFKNEDDKNAILAQAYFLRGFYNYHLALLWGSDNKSLAIMLEDKLPEPYDRPEGHTGKEVFEQAISDFSKALEYNIPESWNDDELGRATKGAVLAYRAKTYMQLSDYEKAKQDLYWLVEGDGKHLYGLTSNYFDNFDKDTENNIESVFEIQYSDIHKAPAGDGDNDLNPNLGLNRGQFFAPPGIGWTDGELRPWLVEEFKKERDLNGEYDIRLKYTAFYEGMENDYKNNDMIYSIESNSKTWSQDNWKGRVFFRKYGSDYYRDYDDYHNPTNVRLVRYADILLLYAECIAQTGGTLSEAVAYVDQVRARVNMPSLAKNHADAASNKDAFLKRLQTERVLELATEGHRWGDIKRWGLLDTQEGINELKSRDSDFNNFVIGKHNCLPIPSDEINNNPNIKQNPSY